MKSVPVRAGSNRIPLGPGDRIQPGQAPSPLGTQLCGFGSWLVKPGGTASCCLICALVWQKPSRPAGPHPPQPGDPCSTSGHSFLSRPLSHPLCHLITLSPPAAPAHLAPSDFLACQPASFCSGLPVPSSSSLLIEVTPILSRPVFPYPPDQAGIGQRTEPGTGPSPRNADIQGGGGRRSTAADLRHWSLHSK